MANDHGLPAWVRWMQDNLLLSFLMAAEAYLLGSLMALGWVRDIETPGGWGIFHGIGIVLFFAAGAAAAGVALRCSITAADAFQMRRWGTALFNFVGVLAFSIAEIWASLSERSTHLAPTPADTAVLQIVGWRGIPLSPTLIVVALILPFASLYWGFSQRNMGVIESAEERAKRHAAELAEAEHQAALRRRKAGRLGTMLAANFNAVRDGIAQQDSPDTATTDAPSITEDTTPDMPPDGGGNGTGKRRLKAVTGSQWTKRELQEYASRRYAQNISDEQAVAMVRMLGDGKRMGRAYVAHKRSIMAAIDRQYAGASQQVHVAG